VPLCRQEQVLERAAEADVELAPVGIGHGLSPLEICEDTHGIRLHRETPRLRIPRGGRQDRVAEKVAELLLDRGGSGEAFF
jgi:hypothetical protein